MSDSRYSGDWSLLLVLTDQANDRLDAPLPWKARMVWTGGFADRGAALAYGASLWPVCWNGRAARSSGMDNAALYAVAPAGDVLVGAITLEHEHRPECRCACAQAEVAMAKLARLCAERAEDVCGLEGQLPIGPHMTERDKALAASVRYAMNEMTERGRATLAAEIGAAAERGDM